MELIGQGMEGAVYDLGDGRVSKTWFDRRRGHAITTATIYDTDANDGHYVWCVGNLNRLPI